MTAWQRLSVTGALAALLASVVAAGPASAMPAPVSESGLSEGHTDTAASSSKPRQRRDVLPWNAYTDGFPSAALSSEIGKRTLMVVPMDAVKPSGSAKSIRRVRVQILNEVKEFWESQIPGMQVRIVLRDPVKVSKAYCTNASLAWDLARKEARGFNPSTPRQHLAAIVECGHDGAFGLGDLSSGFGKIYTNGWDSYVIAHEFGHNLYMVHSNSSVCPRGATPKPGRCKQLEYGDPGDIMGIGLDGLRDVVVSGAWRALWLGAQKVPLNDTATVTLSKPRRGVTAKPAMISTPIGHVFLDYQPHGVASEASECRVDGVATRIAARDGDSPSQILLPARTPLGDVWTAGPLAPEVPWILRRV